MTLQEFDQKLQEAGPRLAAMLASKPDLSPERIARLNQMLETVHPFLRELTSKQMKDLLLKVLGEKAMTGLEIADRLEKANIKLKDGGGEGVIYGLLAKLELAGCVRGEWREAGDRMNKIYRTTEKGTSSLREAKDASTQLHAWSEMILSHS